MQQKMPSVSRLAVTLKESSFLIDSSPEEWKNGPIGLQVTAKRLEEEKVVDMLCKIRDALAK
jgi:hypothetical protein